MQRLFAEPASVHPRRRPACEPCLIVRSAQPFVPMKTRTGDHLPWITRRGHYKASRDQPPAALDLGRISSRRRVEPALFFANGHDRVYFESTSKWRDPLLNDSYIFNNRLPFLFSVHFFFFFSPINFSVVNLLNFFVN